MWPADTLEQARSFYARPGTIEQVLKLEDEGWRITPNFHFGFMATGYCWTATSMPVAQYMRYWLERIVDAGQIERRYWDQYWHNLVSKKIANREDRDSFDRDFTNTARASATPRPGIACTFAAFASHDIGMPPVRPFAVPALLLRRASESRPPALGPEDYDVIGKDGEVIGRIVRTATGPAG
jgi:hypothetical protein